jgi:hypothetical protein
MRALLAQLCGKFHFGWITILSASSFKMGHPHLNAFAAKIFVVPGFEGVGHALER